MKKEYITLENVYNALTEEQRQEIKDLLKANQNNK